MTQPEDVVYTIRANDDASRTQDKIAGSLDKTTKAAGGLGEELKDTGRDADFLNKHLAKTQTHLLDLVKAFDETGDAGLFKDMRKDRRMITQLTQMKKLLGEVGDAGADAARAGGKAVISGIGDTLSAIPSQLKGAAIVGGGAAATAIAPMLGGAIAGAIVGGAGIGGVLGGIALAAQDERVRAAVGEMASNLADGFRDAGTPMIEPLLDQLDDLQGVGSGFARDLKAMVATVAPALKPLVTGLSGLQNNLGPGLARIAEASKPVIRMIASELPKFGDAIGDFLTAVSSESDGAVMGLQAVFQLLQSGIRLTGDAIANLSAAWDFMVRKGAEISGIVEDIPLPWLAHFASEANDNFEEMIGSLAAAGDASHDFAGGEQGIADATAEANKRLMEQHTILKAQHDPMFALIKAQRDVTDAQAAYNDAVKEHGRNSKEARDASLDVAQAVLDMQGAVAAAAGKFDGQLSPAMRATLRAAGLTERQLRDVEIAFRRAAEKGQDFAGEYTATVRLHGFQRTLSQLQAINRERGSGVVGGGGGAGIEARAAGGPVLPDRPYLVGESGPELVTFGQHGQVHSAAATQQMLSGSRHAMGFGGSGPVVLTLGPVPAGADDITRLIYSLLQRMLLDLFGGDVTAGLSRTGGGPL